MKTENGIVKELYDLLKSYEKLKRMGIVMDTDKVFARVSVILSTDRTFEGLRD